jgi:hypothetical protein
MKKATTEAAAKNLMNGAKIPKNGEVEAVPAKKSGGIFLTFTVGSSPRPRKPRYQKPQAVKELEELADIANAKAHPQTPEKYLAKSKYRDDTANGLTRCIIDYLHYKGWQAERINTTGVPIDKRRLVTDVLGHSRTIGSVEWRKSGGTVGSADISATIQSKAVKIEVKIGHDRQSPAQREYQRQIEQAGGLYFIARDFTSFVGWYKAKF